MTVVKQRGHFFQSPGSAVWNGDNRGASRRTMSVADAVVRDAHTAMGRVFCIMKVRAGGESAEMRRWVRRDH